jgi:hypothetical protein
LSRPEEAKEMASVSCGDSVFVTRWFTAGGEDDAGTAGEPDEFAPREICIHDPGLYQVVGILLLDASRSTYPHIQC